MSILRFDTFNKQQIRLLNCAGGRVSTIDQSVFCQAIPFEACYTPKIRKVECKDSSRVVQW